MSSHFTKPQSPFISCILATLACLLATPAASAICLSGGNSDTIINALNLNGTAELCQGAVFSANKIIKLKNNQKIFTTGYPTNDSQKALIQVPAGATYTKPVIQAYTAQNAEIRNIRIDGNRAQNPYNYSRALIAISGNNAWLDHVSATNTSGLSAIAASDNPNCSGLRITNSFIGDNGFHPSTNPPGPFANGIDYRCNNGYVGHNHIRNATDGAISFYGGTNTIIEHNWIANDTRSLFSGIIAATLYNGDFTGSIVRNNLIQTCCGQHIHVALAIGTHLWCDDNNPTGDCQTSSGATFINNSGSGTFGFGIVVDGMLNATVQGNNLVMTPWTSQNCYIPGQNWYVINQPHASGSFQPGYINRNVHWPCLGPINL
ncbi:MAG: hypothetical protein SX243_15335 [Acidobacteriota bacterium]|nr:hypothetical protein [Acidobacteriota bacterium]